MLMSYNYNEEPLGNTSMRLRTNMQTPIQLSLQSPHLSLLVTS